MNLTKAAMLQRSVLALSILSVGCRDIADPGLRASRIQLDLRSLVSGTAVPPDFVSVLDTARLRITAGNVDTTQVLPVGQSDSTVSFDVTVQGDTARFRLGVFSNNLTPLYQADTTIPLNRDNFALQLTPRAVNGVLVVWPRNPPYVPVNFGPNEAYTVAQWQLRNAGIDSLLWSVDTLASTGVLFCTMSSERNCLIPQRLSQSGLPETAFVYFRPDSAHPNRTITFTSTVGVASFATTVP